MKNTRKNIVAISGSIKSNSTNELILKTITALYKEDLAVHLYNGIKELPHFNPDFTNEEQLPAVVKEFRKVIAEADGVIICTPEYVFSLPGVLKNAIEWAVSTTIFTDKPVAFIIASASGEKAFESLDLILKTVQARVGDQSKLLIRGAKGKVNSHGQLSDETLQEINELMKSFVKIIEDKEPANVL